MESFTWYILFLPLIASVLITLFTKRNRALSAMLSVGAVVAGFVLSVIVFFAHGGETVELAVPWLVVGDFHAEFGILLDNLSVLMLLVVTGVGGAIHIYSVGYMQEDEGVSRYFAKLSLFTFSMLGIVVSNNFVQMFIFWELVGLSSYLLISFWYQRPAAADAGKKAFLVNRVGDFGFLLGIMMVWGLLGSLNFTELKDTMTANPEALGAMSGIAGLLIFCGAVGKSTQFPLHVWLPDAMEGPTPVSALIHAATMVAAGVYMLCRIFFLLDPLALTVIGWIGAITALLAAVIAIQQNDIKRILAYSTLSQLGYMVMAVGAGAPVAAMFHLATHAFFKALLFLGAGSVIIAMHHEQNIWKMGGLRSRMPTTYWTFLIATLALCGVPPLSGFYSKDAILAAAAENAPVLCVIGTAVAAMTSFYMFRLVFVTFFGEAKTGEAEHAQESPSVMTIPLRVLAVFSVIGGLIGINTYVEKAFSAAGELHSVSWFSRIMEPFSHSPLAAFLGLFAAALGIVVAYQMYVAAERDPIAETTPTLSWVISSKFFFDEIYQLVLVGVQDLIAKLMDWLDRWLIAGFLIGGVQRSADFLGRTVRLLQTGNLQTYALLFAIGVGFVLWLVLGK